MSIRVMTYVWEHSTESGEGLLVHLALADFADDDGVCWPKMAAIAEKARTTERGARGIIERLEAKGELRREIGRGVGRHNAYQVVTEANRNRAPVSLASKTGTQRQQNRNVPTAKPEGRRGDKGEPSRGTVMEPSGARLEERASRAPTERELRAATKATVADLLAEWLEGRAAVKADRYVDPSALTGLKMRIAAGLAAGIDARDLSAAVRAISREPKGSPWYVDERAKQIALEREQANHERRKVDEKAELERRHDEIVAGERASGRLEEARIAGFRRLRIPGVSRERPSEAASG